LFQCRYSKPVFKLFGQSVKEFYRFDRQVLQLPFTDFLNSSDIIGPASHTTLTAVSVMTVEAPFYVIANKLFH
jgi:hypothetical protein